MDTQPTDTQPTDTQPTDTRPTGSGPRHPFPLVLCLEGARCLVVGAGPTAARKARSLLDAGADVTVVAPEIGTEVRGLVDDPMTGDALTVTVRPYASPEAAHFVLVVSATGDAGVDAQVTADALAGGALVNRADTATGVPTGDGGSAAAGTVTLPAVHRAGPVTVAVSTDGSSPALARWLRDRIASVVDSDIATLAVLVDEARRSALESGGTLPVIDWPGAFDDLVPLIADGRIDDARSLLSQLLVAGGKPPPPRGPQHR
jgi:siroheme synthase-like protein